MLRGIFEEIYKKSGLPVEDMEFVKKEDIEFFYNILSYGAHAATEPIVDSVTKEEIGERGVVRFNPANFKFTTPLLNEKLRKRLLTLKLLVHEQVHITQFRGYEESEDQDGNPILVGVNGLTSNDEHLSRTRTAFNEGLVEKIADSVFEEYLRRWAIVL